MTGRLLDIVLPDGGFAITMFEAYFDESGTHEGSPVLCVGGIVIESENAKAMVREWNEMTDFYGLEFFHMADCAHNESGYKHLTKQECLDAEIRAISIVRKYYRARRYGVGVT